MLAASEAREAWGDPARGGPGPVFPCAREGRSPFHVPLQANSCEAPFGPPKACR